MNSQIQRQIEQDKKANESIIKLLLLGAGESGKSTGKKIIFLLMNIFFLVLKQMKVGKGGIDKPMFLFQLFSPDHP